MGENRSQTGSMENLPHEVNGIISRFESLGAVRDRAVTDGRALVRLAANAIRALHRGEDASSLPDVARPLKELLRTATASSLDEY